MGGDKIVQCSLPVWYPAFKSVTIRSRCVALPPDVVQYLLDDGPFVLPVTARHAAEACALTNDGWDASGLPAPEFAAFSTAVVAMICDLGGRVFPKLNWSAPRDAAWIAPSGSLCCTSPEDIFLLLKSSQFVTHDLTRALQQCARSAADISPPFQLVLRTWSPISPELEFRCFVRGRELVAVSQRDHNNYYASLYARKERLQQTFLAPAFVMYSPVNIVSYILMHRKLLNPNALFIFAGVRFTCTVEIDALDVYVSPNERVFVIDFNTFSPATDALLFDWAELAVMHQPVTRATFRLAPVGLLQPSVFINSRVPKDVTDVQCVDDIARLQALFQQGDGSDSSDGES